MPGSTGPPPKFAGARRRRNPPARGDWIEIPPLEAPVLPELDELFEGEWAPETLFAWEAWRQDPVTALWTPADVSFAIDTILLHNAMTPSTANEIRLRMDTLGLTAKGRQHLRWKVVTLEEQAPPQTRRRSQTRRLRAVD